MAEAVVLEDEDWRARALAAEERATSAEASVIKFMQSKDEWHAVAIRVTGERDEARKALTAAEEAKADANRWCTHWQTMAHTLMDVKNDVQGILIELVKVKDLKDTQGKTPEYEERQPKVWQAARMHVLSAMRDWLRPGGPSEYLPPPDSYAGQLARIEAAAHTLMDVITKARRAPDNMTEEEAIQVLAEACGRTFYRRPTP
jgi:hypothetical protein